MSETLLVLREPDIRELLDPISCREAVEEAMTAYASRQAILPGVIGMDFPDVGGEVHVKAGHVKGGAYYAVKMASGFAKNREKRLPASDGMVLLFHADTGRPAAVLLDRCLITDLRTGAAGAVAARHLARRECHRVGVIGAGAQARYQLEALGLVRPYREARIWGRNLEKARDCAGYLARRTRLPEHARFQAVSSAREAVEGADILVTVTPSRDPLVKGEWLSPGALVIAVGSDGPDKRELHPEVFTRADRVIADSLPQCRRLGEIHHALEAGVLTEAKIDAELGQITGGLRPGREDEDHIIICDLTGVGVQDVAAASVVLERARAEGRGEVLSL